MGGANSKLAFRQSVFRLFEDKHIAPTEEDFWEQFWTLPTSTDDVFLLIGANDIRRTRDESRANIETLIDKILLKMEETINASNFPCAKHSINHLLNCCRILTRLMPFIYESEACSEWENTFFWNERRVERKRSTTKSNDTLNDSVAKDEEVDGIMSEYTESSKNDDAKKDTGSEEATIKRNRMAEEEEGDLSMRVETSTEESKDKTEKFKEIKVTTEEEEGQFAGQEASNDEIEIDILPPRGARLIDLTIQALFLGGFTIPLALVNKELKNKVNLVVWEAGVGLKPEEDMGQFKDNEANRTEVLRLLVVLLSKSMYSTPSQLLREEDLWLQYAACQLDRKTVMVLLCSLLNTVCNYDPTGWVPYNHILTASATKEQLITFCLSSLLILLDYRSPQEAKKVLRQIPNEEDITTSRSPSRSVSRRNSFNASPRMSISSNKRENSSTTDNIKETTKLLETITITTPPLETASASEPKMDLEDYVSLKNESPIDQQAAENDFRYFLSKLYRKKDFEYLMNGFYRLLSNPMTAVNTYLPGSTRRTSCYTDVMMLCWRCIEVSKRFTYYLTDSDRALDLTVLLIFHANESKDKLSSTGLIRMCAFMLQTLSSNKEYSIKLNKPFTTHSYLPASVRIYAFNGSYADYLIISIFSLIASTQGRLHSLYPAFILTITNISPYLTNLGVTTCSKLMTLFHSWSSPHFLLADEHNHQLLGYLLETFNHIVHHQYGNNPKFIYALVLRSKDIESLRTLTFDKVTKEVAAAAAAAARKTNRDADNHNNNVRNSTQFTPTEKWFNHWKAALPIVTLTKLMETLLPPLEEKCKTTNDSELLTEFVKTIDLPSFEGYLEAGVYLRQFQWGEALVVWFRSVMWGQNYVNTMREFGPWNGTHVKLFQIKEQEE
ncbi:high-temperature-induced dauer-formation protein-domain-containing protein [Mycotypha africana]|uniref:high-temperature-induced dauer-formation protein-domain-containing protein n=1 Tax=Mycotypha africana TaxID=64632 RepID=UPI0023009D36|nr:high-temperature-induced dauer-formation protein-domain-containing protein [Mycotypha africana]KAI8967237.1 high-temperature-induced dauer-formation protein-domain-containing protein [Mycotypha africana]